MARYGGEEFVVVCPETDPRAPTHLAARVCERRPRRAVHRRRATPVQVTVSCGRRLLATQAATLSGDLVRAADDAAVRRAKGSGRDQVRRERRTADRLRTVWAMTSFAGRHERCLAAERERRDARPSSPPPVWARGSCRRPRRCRRRCCRSSTSRPSSTSWRRRSRAGLRDILMITGRNKTALEDHFDRHWELEQALEAKGDDAPARAGARVDRPRRRPLRPPGRARRASATRCSARPTHVGDEPFAVLLGDDLIDERDHAARARCSRSASSTAAASSR